MIACSPGILISQVTCCRDWEMIETMRGLRQMIITLPSSSDWWLEAKFHLGQREDMIWVSESFLICVFSKAPKSDC